MIGEPCEKPLGFNEGSWRLSLVYHIMRTAKSSKEAANLLGLHLVLRDCRRMAPEDAAEYEAPIGRLFQYTRHNIAVGGEILFFGENEPTVVYWGEVKYPQEMRIRR